MLRASSVASARVGRSSRLLLRPALARGLCAKESTYVQKCTRDTNPHEWAVFSKAAVARCPPAAASLPAPRHGWRIHLARRKPGRHRSRKRSLLTRPTPLDRWTSTMTVSSVAPVAPCCYMSGPRRWRSAAESRRSHALRRHHHHGGDQRHVPQARHRHHGRRHLQVLACSRPFPPSLTARLCGSTPPVVNARRSTGNPLFSATPRNCTRHATHTTHARHA